MKFKINTVLKAGEILQYRTQLNQLKYVFDIARTLLTYLTFWCPENYPFSFLCYLGGLTNTYPHTIQPKSIQKSEYLYVVRSLSQRESTKTLYTILLNKTCPSPPRPLSISAYARKLSIVRHEWH